MIELFKLDQLITEFQDNLHSIKKQLESIKDNQNLMRAEFERCMENMNILCDDVNRLKYGERKLPFMVNFLHDNDKA